MVSHQGLNSSLTRIQGLNSSSSCIPPAWFTGWTSYLLGRTRTQSLDSYRLEMKRDVKQTTSEANPQSDTWTGGRDNCLPPHPLILDFTMTHDLWGRSNVHVTEKLTHHFAPTTLLNLMVVEQKRIGPKYITTGGYILIWQTWLSVCPCDSPFQWTRHRDDTLHVQLCSEFTVQLHVQRTCSPI
jgi:hypothetical protein